MRADIEAIFADHQGIVRATDHPKLRRTLFRLQQRGELELPLPGIFCLPGMSEDFEAAIRIGVTWAGPDAVLVGRAAARFTYWKDCRSEVLTFAVPRRVSERRRQWQRIYRRLRPEDLFEQDGVTVTVPALTAVDLADEPIGGQAIDEALRSRAADLPAMWSMLAAYPARAGNLARTMLLEDSRDDPWSEGERDLHRLLRSNGITGWVANAALRIKDENHYADVLFPDAWLIVEFDGWEFHQDREAFERDRRRRNELELAGYLVLNFTWRQLTEDPDWVIACIRRGLDGRRRWPVARMANQVPGSGPKSADSAA